LKRIPGMERNEQNDKNHRDYAIIYEKNSQKGQKGARKLEKK
jgi:hypothetical protein